jgi:hypothetical protein
MIPYISNEINTKDKFMENTVSVELNAEQMAFLTGWQKTHEQELGIEIPLAAMVRKAVDGAMKSAQKPAHDERPAGRGFGGGERPAGRSFDKKPGFGGPRKSFGDRPAGRGGPKFDMMAPRTKTRTFDK